MLSSEFTLVLFFTGALVLAWSGAAKLRQPGQLARALSATGLPAGVKVVRFIGAAELALGSTGLVWPTAPVAIGVGLAYLAFASFLTFLLAKRPATQSCGCAGSREIPPSWLHVGLDVAAGAAALALAATDGGGKGLLSVAAPLPLAGTSLVAGVGLLAYLAFLSAAYLPGAITSYEGRR